MSSLETQVELSFFVKPADSLTGARCHRAYPHQQVIGAAIEPDEYVGGAWGISRRFTMPSDLAYRIIDCAVVLHGNSKYYNCHRFSRVIAGVLEPLEGYATDDPGYINGQPEIPSLRPPAFSYDRATKRTETAIDMGAVGIVGALDPHIGLEIPHSVVGLGSEAEVSLQFTCYHGMMSLVRNSDLLEFYRSLYPKDVEVDLWQLDQSLLSSPSASVPAGQDVSG